MGIGCIEDLANDDYIKGKCFSNNNEKIHEDSLELLYLYVGNYKVFHNTPINLNARYIFNYDKENNLLDVTLNEKFIDLFGDNINLKVFCGKNGTGKTTIIELIQKIDSLKEEQCFIVLKDKNNKFITNNRNLRINFLKKKERICDKKIDSSFKIAELSLSKNKQNNVVYSTERKIIHNYMLYPQFYSIWNTKFLFDGFEIRFWNFEEKVKLIAENVLQVANKTFEDIFIDDLYDYFAVNPLQYILYFKANRDFWNEFCCMNIENYIKPTSFDIVGYIEKAFENFWSTLKISKSDYREENAAFCMYMYNYHYWAKRNQSIRNEIYHEFKTLNIDKHPFIPYKLNKKEYLNVMNDFEEGVKNVLDLTQSYPYLFDCMQLMYDNIMLELFYLKPFKEIGYERIYFEDLSSGEYSKIKMITDLITMVYDNGLERTILFNDEIDAHLHPSWTQNYIYEYLKTIRYNNYLARKTKKRFDKKLNIIITTHSPFILSEVTNDYVEYLEKQNFKSIIKPKESINNSFAGNVLQMFSDNFFLESSMGKYSKEILKEIIAFMEHEESETPILLLDNYSNEEKTELCRRVIDIVGDAILQKMLKEKFERFLNEKNYI